MSCRSVQNRVECMYEGSWVVGGHLVATLVGHSAQVARAPGCVPGRGGSLL